jgi:hypothetical protein
VTAPVESYPDYVGVGALGTPTDWWHRALLEHPDVEPRAPGERSLDFFAGFWSREMSEADVAAYRSRFPHGDGRVVGEWTPRYLFEPWTPLLLQRAAPEARLLVMLRDPVEVFRAKLGSQPYLRPRHEDHGMGDATARGRYAAQLRNLWAHCARERTLVLQYERCLRDPEREYARMLGFLGLREDFRPRRFEPPTGQAPSRYRRGRRALGVARRRLSGRPVPARPARGESPRLWPEIERALLADLEPAVADLAALVGEAVDLALWPRFAHLGGTVPTAPGRG